MVKNKGNLLLSLTVLFEILHTPNDCMLSNDAEA